MPSCVFRKCTNYDAKMNKTHAISYHMFPRDKGQLRHWTTIVRKQRSESDWMPSNGSRICSNHFRTTDKYISKKGRTLLKRNAVPFIEASTSATTLKQRDARNKRKGSLPEAKTIIKSVFNYLQTEYENFKTFTGGSCDLSPLENILGRTAAAIGVSEDEVTAVLDEGGSDDSSDESSSKRARVSRDYYDENISPIEEDSSGETTDEAEPDNMESSIETEENPIETLKVEIDENVEYHSKPNTGISFQIPLSREQMSAIHQSSLSEPTHVEVKQEPVDIDEQQQMSVFHQSSLPTHAAVKKKPADVEEQQRLKQLELGDDVEYTGGEQDPLGEPVKAETSCDGITEDQHGHSKMQNKSIIDKLKFENDIDEYEIDAARRRVSSDMPTSCGDVKEEICYEGITEDLHGDSESTSAVHHLLQSNFEVRENQ